MPPCSVSSLAPWLFCFLCFLLFLFYLFFFFPLFPRPHARTPRKAALNASTRARAHGARRHLVWVLPLGRDVAVADPPIAIGVALCASASEEEHTHIHTHHTHIHTPRRNTHTHTYRCDGYAHTGEIGAARSGRQADAGAEDTCARSTGRTRVGVNAPLVHLVCNVTVELCRQGGGAKAARGVARRFGSDPRRGGRSAWQRRRSSCRLSARRKGWRTGTRRKGWRTGSQGAGGVLRTQTHTASEQNSAAQSGRRTWAGACRSRCRWRGRRRAASSSARRAH